MRALPPFLLAGFIVAALLRIDFFFTVIYFLAALVLLSRLWIGRSGRQLHIRRAFADHAFTGDKVPIDLTIENQGWLPIPWLEIRESMPAALMGGPFPPRVVSLGPHEAWHGRYTLGCIRRGYYTLGPAQLQTGDLLGVRQLALQAPEPRRLTVYPRVVPLARLGLPTRSPLVALPARAPLFEDPSRLRGVRDYRPGDARRRMHWSATARLDRPVVKQYEPAIARQTMICLDLDRASYETRRRFEATELAICAAASLAAQIAGGEGLPAGLLTEAQDPLTGTQRLIVVPPRAERGHLVTGILEVLARVDLATGTAFPDLLRRESVQLAWGTTLAVLTGQASSALLETLLYLRRRGFVVVLILVQPGYRPAADESRLAGMVVYRIGQESHLEVLSA
ncbi:MAG TPA: DUF58 domain-containing protein [Chloroflexia bacterium]|nr:DUF58 domain-containing protein [Chloroflexia bacterium]